MIRMEAMPLPRSLLQLKTRKGWQTPKKGVLRIAPHSDFN